jgi:thiamine biosynthesis lipoprotein
MSRARQSHSREWLFCIVLLLATGCARQAATVELSGATMGTTWHVTYVPGRDAPAVQAVQSDIEVALEAVNISMSTYLADSEISRFNTALPGTQIPVSPDFLAVLGAALEVGERSGGAYDVTVAPLVDLWGFGPGGAVDDPPSPQAVEAARARVGQNALLVDTAAGVVSSRVERALDFSSIAKGFAVDKVAERLLELGIEHFLVEVVAIERPDTAGRAFAAAVRLTEMAVATSGDYRNYFEVDGKRYSHAIDPRSGYPVVHDLVSVTVLHPSTMRADAWATALIVLGGEEAATVARREGLAVYFIRRVNGELVHSHSPALAPYLAGAEAG